MTLPVDVYSPDQLSEAIMELRSYTASQRDAVVRARAHADNQTAEGQTQVSEALKHVLDSAQTAGESLEQLLKQLEELLAKAPVAHLTLAALPNRAIKRQITLWFRTEIHPTMLLTFAARGDIGGGAVVHIGSHLYDLSFKKQILANKNRLTEIAGV